MVLGYNSSTIRAQSCWSDGIKLYAKTRTNKNSVSTHFIVNTAWNADCLINQITKQLYHSCGKEMVHPYSRRFALSPYTEIPNCRALWIGVKFIVTFYRGPDRNQDKLSLRSQKESWLLSSAAFLNVWVYNIYTYHSLHLKYYSLTPKELKLRGLIIQVSDSRLETECVR